MVEKNNRAEQELIEQLKTLPLQQVPTDLTERIMARVSAPKKSMFNAVWQYVLACQPITFRPIYAFAVILLVCSSFYLGKHFQQPVSVADTQSEPLEDPRLVYLMGRELLQTDGSQAQALHFLQRASLLEPENPEFAYWEGIGYWASGEKEKERESYLRGLEIDPGSVPLLINLGHSYLSDKKYNEALRAYQQVLDLAVNNSVALYNSGLAYRALGMIAEEKSSWRSFLQENRIGSQAFRAVQRLNEYDDFSFRTYLVGGRKIILNQESLLDESVSERRKMDELVSIASILEMDERLDLEVIVFVEHDREAARERAAQLKSMIIENSAKSIGKRVKLSWFDSPERIKRSNDMSDVINSEGVLLFSHLTPKNEREFSI